MKVPLIDVLGHRQIIGDLVDQSLQAAVGEGAWIMGRQCKEFELALTSWIGIDSVQSIGCGNGTDALVLALQALGLKAGQGVVVPAFTFVATAEAVVMLGGIPVFADVDPDTFNLKAASIRAATKAAQSASCEVVGIIAVDLFGQPAPYQEIMREGRELGCWVVADAAQSFGGDQDGRRVGALADVTTTSFFPAKPLGCYGDGGAVFTEREDLADRVRSLRVHGKGLDKYDNVLVGQNSRLDTLQAAVLLPKLTILGDEMRRRQEIAQRYAAELTSAVVVPHVVAGNTSAWAQYTLRSRQRDRLRKLLETTEIGHAVYYPKPLHKQTAYQKFDRFGVSLAASEALSQEVLSIPMHPYLTGAEQSFVIETINGA